MCGARFRQASGSSSKPKLAQSNCCNPKWCEQHLCDMVRAHLHCTPLPFLRSPGLEHASRVIQRRYGEDAAGFVIRIVAVTGVLCAPCLELCMWPTFYECLNLSK